MYSYQYAVGRYKGYQPGAHIIDISKIPVKSLIQYFTVLNIVLYDQTYSRNVMITLDDYTDKFAQYNGTINDFLKANGDETLTYRLNPPKNTLTYAQWESLSHKGFYHHPGNLDLSTDKQDKLTSATAPDIRIIRDNYTYSDYGKLASYALFIMNGCFVRAVGNKTGLYLRGAGKDYQSAKSDLFLSAINFEKIGKITTIPITSTLLRHDYASKGRRYFIDLPSNTSLENKTIWVVFNGQLLVDEDIIAKTNDTTLMLDMKYVDAMTHYITYGKRIRTPTWSDQTQDEKYLYNALIAETSFVVIIDNPLVGVTLEPMTPFKYPISHQTQEKFLHPVMLENGLFPYCLRRTYGNEARIVNVDIASIDRPVIDSVGKLGDNTIYTGKNAGDPGELPRGFLFKIFSVDQ